MTLLKITSADAFYYGNEVNGGSSSFFNLTGVRGGRRLARNVGHWARPDFLNLPSSVTYVYGWAFYIDDFSNPLCVFNSATSIAQFQVRPNSDGSISLRVGGLSGSALLGTSSTGLITSGGSGSVFYCEVKWSSNGSTSTVEVRINGTVAISWSGAQDFSSVAQFGHGQYNMDIYLLNNAGSTNNDYLGDCRVEHLVPTASGTDDNWTSVGGTPTNKVTSVTTPTDDENTYIKTTVASQRQTFVMSDLTTTTGTVKGVEVLPKSRPENATARIASVARVSGSAANSPGALVNTGVYRNEFGIFETSPATGTAWTTAEVNAMEAGVVVLP